MSYPLLEVDAAGRALDVSEAGDALLVLVRDADAVNGGVGRERRIDEDEFAVFRPGGVVADLAVGKSGEVGDPSGLHVVEHEFALVARGGGDVAAGGAGARGPEPRGVGQVGGPAGFKVELVECAGCGEADMGVLAEDQAVSVRGPGGNALPAWPRDGLLGWAAIGWHNANL